MNKKFKKQIYLILLITLIVLFLLRIFFVNSSRINSTISNFIYPIVLFENKLINPIKNWFSNFFLLEEKKKLEFYLEENQNLKSKIIALESQLDFVNQTKELVEFSKKYNVNYGILAQIIFKNFDSKEHFYLIDAGYLKGIKEDMCVIYKNFLIGRIKEVHKYYSKVILITDQSCKVASYCVTTGIKSIHVGQNDINTTKLDFINHLDNLLVGDLVLSSGEGTVFPRGLGLGKIKNVEPDGFNYKVEVETLVQFDRLEYCVVIEKGAEINFEQVEQPKILSSQEVIIAQDINNNKEKKEIQEVKDFKEIKKIKKVQEETPEIIKDIKESEIQVVSNDNISQIAQENMGTSVQDAPIIQDQIIIQESNSNN